MDPGVGAVSRSGAVTALSTKAVNGLSAAVAITAASFASVGIARPGFSGMLAATMSVNSSYLLGWSSIIAQDIVSPMRANPLSAREREVLQLVARGYTYKQTGAELFIAERTVENHVRNILGKLHLSRRAELIRWAADHGIG